MYKPLYYDELNFLEGIRLPNTLKVNSQIFWYYERSLTQKAISTLEWDGIPEEWDKNYFYYILFLGGFIPIIKTNKYGNIPQWGVPGGEYNIFLKPMDIIIANKFINKRYRIGKDCEVIRLTPDWRGIYDIITYYAEKLACLDSSINQSIVNSRLAYAVTAKNKRGAQSLKKVMDKIFSGEPAVVYDDTVKKDNSLSDEPFTLFNNEVGRNYITDKQLADYHTIMNMFNTEIGIPNNPQEKGERLITNEVEVNNAETVSRLTTWIETIRSDLEKVNDMFELNITVKQREYITPNTGAKEAGKLVKDGEKNE